MTSIKNFDDINAFQKKLAEAADLTLMSLRKACCESANGTELLQRLRFDFVGHHPIEQQDLHLIEQVNQTATYSVALAAVRLLLKKHPQLEFEVIRATAAGPDIRSSDGQVEAEIFAAIKPDNNRKLEADVKRMAESQAWHRYVIFSAPKQKIGPRDDLENKHGVGGSVEIWCCDRAGSFEVDP